MEANGDPELSSGYLGDIPLRPGLTALMYMKHACGLDACRACHMRTIRVVGTGASAEKMNRDIVFLVCPYLDFGTLSCFAAAYPQWSAAIYSRLKKKMLAIKLNLEFGAKNNEVKGSFPSDERRDDSPKNNVVVYNIEAGEMKSPQSIWIAPSLRKELHQSVWKYMPLDLMEVTGTSIVQNGRSRLPEDVHTMLAKVTTKDLYLQFSTRDEARRMLRAIRFSAGSTVYPRDISKGYTDRNVYEVVQSLLRSPKLQKLILKKF